MSNLNPNESPYLDRIIKEYMEGLNKFYPGIRYTGRFSMYSEDEPRSAKLRLTLRNCNVEGTDYACKDQKYLVHYTSSLQNLFNILNSGFLRLTSLDNLNDPQELMSLAKEVNCFGKEQLNYFKKSFHSVSFCVAENLTQPDKFPMWRLYGGDGYGATIVFEVLNSGVDWHQYMLAKVQYGNSDERSKYKKFIRFHNEFQSRYNQPIRNWPEAVIAFTGMHKNEIWNYEEEIRLISHYGYNPYTLDSEHGQGQAAKLRHAIAPNGKPYSYLELPLYGGAKYKDLKKFYNNNGFEDRFNSSLPMLKINKVILGYRLSVDTALNCEDIIARISKDYEYNIIVSDSHLKQYMT